MKKVSSEWIKEYNNVKILDPDGWDRKNYSYSFNEEKITRKEFERRLMYSTLQWSGKISDLMKGRAEITRDKKERERKSLFHYKQFF